MKRLVIALLLLSSTALSWAQTTIDGFENYQNMVGKDVVFYGLYSYYSQNGPFMYTYPNDKLIVIKDDFYYKTHDVALVSVKEIVKIKKKSYLKVEMNNNDFFFLIDNKNGLLQLARSKSYWEEKMNEYDKLYGYVLYPSFFTEQYNSLANLYLNKYVPIKWKEVIMPKDIGGEIVYNCAIGDSRRQISEEDFNLHKDELVTINDYYTAKRAHDEEVAESKRRQEEIDSQLDSTLACSAMIRHTSSSVALLKKNDITYDDNDTLWLSIYGSKEFGSLNNKVHNYEGYVMGTAITFSNGDLEFGDDSLSNEAKLFMIRRGNNPNGLEARKQLASKNDSIQLVYQYNKQITRLKTMTEALKKIENFRNQKKIFILKQSYSYSDYQFGLAFRFYNCYNKVVKYIEIKAVAYNQVGDVQKDYFGESTKSVRCIGPIEKGEEAEYEFNKMFWDEYDVIHHLTVVDVKITFMDGSIVRYSGKENVRQHTSEYYSDEQRKILKDFGIEL